MMQLVAGCVMEGSMVFLILLKEYNGTFYELQWGLYGEMPTNTQGQSDIVIHQTNI
jgi:hypothetical protein